MVVGLDDDTIKKATVIFFLKSKIVNSDVNFNIICVFSLKSSLLNVKNSPRILLINFELKVYNLNMLLESEFDSNRMGKKKKYYRS